MKNGGGASEGRGEAVGHETLPRPAEGRGLYRGEDPVEPVK